MITLYWSPKTRASLMFWVLEEIGRPYRLHNVDWRSDPRPPDPEFAAASPLGKVPALSDGTVQVADSAAITLYLADRYAPGVLAPLPDDPARGMFLFWLFFTPSAIEPALVEKFVDIPPNPTSYAWGSFERMYDTLDTRLKAQDWVGWDRFSAADMPVAASVHAMELFDLCPLTPAMSAYRDRCYARPAQERGKAKEAAATEALDG